MNSNAMDKESKGKNRKSTWLVFAMILCTLQLVSSIMAGYMLVRVNMLPNLYLGILLGLLVAAWIIVFWMIYYVDQKKQKKGIRKGYFGRRTFGSILSVLVIIACIFGISILDQFMATVNAVTQIRKTQTEEINIYVMNDDPAESLEDAADYIFGVCTEFDYENSMQTRAELEEIFGKPIQIMEFEDIFDMIDALYDGRCQALILNGAYITIVEELEGYETFYEKTRILHMIEIETEVIEELPADTDTAVEEKTESDRPDTNAFVVYISGSDTRNKKLSRGNSDVNILAVVNPDTRKVLLVSTPRDYYIDISIAPGNMDKLTHCGVYGPQCSMDTLGALYDVPVDYYAQINFTGFETLIDAIGGVNVYSDASFTVGSYSYQKGDNYMDGKKALAFARERHAFGDGDRARGRHQMAVIQAIIKKMTGSATLITNYSDIMDSLSGMFTTSFPQSKISALVKAQLADMSGWDVESVSVSGSDSSNYCYSLRRMKTYVMIPYQDDVADASARMKEILYP